MKITDESMAKALGWKRQGKFWFSPQGAVEMNPNDRFPSLPEFTTSLDAIVAEIEARGLLYGLCKVDLDACPDLEGYRATISNAKKAATLDDKTAPLALCAALLFYLKEQP